MILCPCLQQAPYSFSHGLAFLPHPFSLSPFLSSVGCQPEVYRVLARQQWFYQLSYSDSLGLTQFRISLMRQMLKIYFSYDFIFSDYYSMSSCDLKNSMKLVPLNFSKSSKLISSGVESETGNGSL